jgi:hypothetical protein
MQVRRALKRLRPFLLVGAATGTVIVVRRTRPRRPPRSVVQHRPEPADSKRQHEMPAWVEAVNGACPPTHPVKVKTTSGIFHVPGGQFYERTRPERCYVDAAAAEADGYRAAKAGKGTRSPA